MINKETFYQYTSIQETLESEAMEILTQLNEIEEIDGFELLQFQSVNDYDIVFFGERFTQCRGHETYQHSVPSELLYDEDFKIKYFDDLNEKVNESIKKSIEKRKQDELYKVAREKAKYLELKSKFEKGGK